MFRYETISSHDGKYKLSALLDKDGYDTPVFTKDGNIDVSEFPDNLIEITGSILAGVEKGFPIRLFNIPIEKKYYGELLEMFETAIELGYFANVNQEK